MPFGKCETAKRRGVVCFAQSYRALLQSFQECLRRDHTDRDMRVRDYNESRPHRGRWCFGKTPIQTFLDTMPMTKENAIAA